MTSQRFFKLMIIVSALLFQFSSCKKEGTGGKARIYGVVAHHSVPIAHAKVYIKYGAIESPGTNVSVYNDEVKCDAQGNYVFSNLVTGKYYLFAVGTDVNTNGVSEQVTGGLGVALSRKDNRELDIPVTE